MNNILSLLKNVNFNSLPKEKITEYQRILLSELAFASFGGANFKEAVTAEGIRFHKIAFGEKIQNRCTFDIPTQCAVNPEPKKEVVRHRNNKRLLFPEVFECSENGNAIDPLIKPLLKKVSDRWGYLASWFGDRYRFFQVNAKGTPAYNLKMYWRIHDACKQFDEVYKQCYFATLTMSQKEYNGDFIKAWKDFSSQLGVFQKQLTKTFGGKYVVVLESHKSGFPHAHLLFYTDFNFSDSKYTYSKKKRCYFMTNGRLRDFFDKYWTCGYSQIDKNRRKDTSNYLSKYISKAEDNDIRQLLGKSRLTQSDKKEILTLILPMIAEVRAFRISKFAFSQKNLACAISAPACVSLTEKVENLPKENLAPLTEDEKRQAIAYLKTLCTKSPLNCANPVFGHSRGQLLKLYKVEPKKLDALPLHKNRKIAESGCRLSCKGCILSELANLFVKGDTKLLEPVENWQIFADIYFNRMGKIDVTAWHAVSGAVVKQEGERFRRILSKEFEKYGSWSDIKSLLHAIYTTNRVLLPFVVPESWQQDARFLANTAVIKSEVSTQDEINFLKAILHYALF